MDDLREKVILGIENCIKTDSVTECRKTECPFIACRESCLEWLLRSALSLLKEQEARLLTLDEAKALPCDTDIWIEYLNIFNEPVTYAATICHNTKLYFTHRPADVLYHWYDYEKGFVIWLGRPTEEQQKAVNWE